MKCVLGMCIVMQQQAGENNTANCLPPSRPMWVHSFFSPDLSQLSFAGCPWAYARAYRPAALAHLILLLAPKDQSPPFVIGKHAEKLVCASHDKEGVGTEGRNKEDTNISIFSREVGVCTKPVTFSASLLKQSVVYFIVSHTILQ